ncbi:hypothetical protein [Janibacter sp. G1551]|uniref:hypothetical protein n=1 Tax=Janibacter sp. G1551 TaxID=3420440 RepID=UPI003D03EC73
MSKSATTGRYVTPRDGRTKVLTKSGRMIPLDTQRAAARVYVEASKKTGEPVSATVRKLAAEAS